jgi:hypothetical protein
LYACIDGVKRAPAAKGERTVCRDCGGLLTAVVPVESVAHWRHKAGDCDPWSEPEDHGISGGKSFPTSRAVRLFCTTQQRESATVPMCSAAWAQVRRPYCSFGTPQFQRRSATPGRCFTVRCTACSGSSTFIVRARSWPIISDAADSAEWQDLRRDALDGTEQSVHRKMEARDRSCVLRLGRAHSLSRERNSRSATWRSVQARRVCALSACTG